MASFKGTWHLFLGVTPAITKHIISSPGLKEINLNWLQFFEICSHALIRRNSRSKRVNIRICLMNGTLLSQSAPRFANYSIFRRLRQLQLIVNYIRSRLKCMLRMFKSLGANGGRSFEGCATKVKPSPTISIRIGFVRMEVLYSSFIDCFLFKGNG